MKNDAVTEGTALAPAATEENAMAAVVVVEWMVHVGYASSCWDSFNCSPDREHELAFVMAPETRQLLADQGLDLTTFGALTDLYNAA